MDLHCIRHACLCCVFLHVLLAKFCSKYDIWIFTVSDQTWQMPLACPRDKQEPSSPKMFFRFIGFFHARGLVIFFSLTTPSPYPDKPPVPPQRARFRSISGAFRVRFGSVSGLFRVRFGPVSGDRSPPKGAGKLVPRENCRKLF